MKSIEKSFLLILLFHMLFWVSCVNQKVKMENANPSFTLKRNIERLHERKDNYVLVAAHRGDWRNAPENSIQALKNAIEKGVDVMELDLNRTKDGHLVVMHDRTIDRTTNGTGKPGDYTLAELKNFRLKNGLGRVTQHTIPTLREMLLEAKGKILLDIDKGFMYYPEVIQELKETGTMDQIIYNISPNVSYDSVISRYGALEEKLLFMPVINYSHSNAKSIQDSYAHHKNIIYQPIFDKDDYELLNEIPALNKNGYQVWINSLWPALCGGHDDDRALEDPDGSWDWIIKHGATIIQTDRPVHLLEYLREKGLHD